MTPIERAAIARRWHAAEDLERARQVVREIIRYGYTVSQQQLFAIHTAEIAYDNATATVAQIYAVDPLCGTNGGYQRHLRNGEPIDAACKEGHNAYNRDNRALHKLLNSRTRSVA